VPEKPQAKRFLVSGMVQGVGYRFFVQRVAERLRVAGYVMNRRDGRVEVYAIGPGESLEALRAELEQGPRGASVSAVREEDVEYQPRYARGFLIEHDW
jgi:acylphosphatase